MENENIQVVDSENIQVEVEPKDYSTLSLVFGILSIVLSCCTGVFTFWFGLVATILGKKTMNGDPEKKKGKPGFICGIIGMTISVIGTIFWIIYIFVVVGLASIYSGNLFTSDYTDYSLDSQYEDSLSSYSEDATYENFITLEIGMTLKEVEAILGEGLDIGGGDFEWESDLGYIDITFDSKGKLEYMSQSVSEWSENPAVTKEVQGKIVEGMTLDEVEAILGEGILYSVELYDGIIYKNYTWNGSDISIYVEFENNKAIYVDSSSY